MESECGEKEREMVQQREVKTGTPSGSMYTEVGFYLRLDESEAALPPQMPHMLGPRNEHSCTLPGKKFDRQEVHFIKLQVVIGKWHALPEIL